MPRPLRSDFPGAVFHVTSRGANRTAVFRDDADRSLYLRFLRASLSAHDLACLTFVLMTNHVHLVLVSGEGRLHAGMQRLNGRYAQRFNRRHRRSGPLWQSRYHAEPIRTDRHLLEAIAYVADNPVRAGLSPRADGWRWSGHAELIGVTAPGIVDVPRTLAYFAANGGDGRARYRAYVMGRSAAT